MHTTIFTLINNKDIRTSFENHEWQMVTCMVWICINLILNFLQGHIWAYKLLLKARSSKRKVLGLCHCLKSENFLRKVTIDVIMFLVIFTLLVTMIPFQYEQTVVHKDFKIKNELTFLFHAYYQMYCIFLELTSHLWLKIVKFQWTILLTSRLYIHS